MTESVAETIKIQRQVLGLDQSTLAEQVGITSSHLSRIEAGLRQGSPAVLRALAEALQIDPGELVEAAQPTPQLRLSGVEVMRKQFVRHSQTLAQANEEWADWVAVHDPECGDLLRTVALRLRKIAGEME